MDSDNTFKVSFPVYAFMVQLEAIGADIPDYILDEITAHENTGLGAGLDSQDLKEDVKYLRTIILIERQLAALEEGQTLTLTQEIVDMVNATMVGKTHFVENGMTWNFFTDPENDLRYRTSDIPNWKLYFGLSTDKKLRAIIKDVTDYLVSQGAKGLTYYNKVADTTQPDGFREDKLDLVFGIEAELTLPTA